MSIHAEYYKPAIKDPRPASARGLRPDPLDRDPSYNVKIGDLRSILFQVQDQGLTVANLRYALFTLDQDMAITPETIYSIMSGVRVAIK